MYAKRLVGLDVGTQRPQESERVPIVPVIWRGVLVLLGTAEVFRHLTAKNRCEL